MLHLFIVNRGSCLTDYLTMEGLDSTSKQLKRKNRSYEAEALSQALTAIKLGKHTPYSASLHYKIPQSTLRSRLKMNARARLQVRGPNPLLSSEEELCIVEWMKERHLMGNTVSWTELANSIRDGIFKEPQAATFTRGWLQKFRRRHPDVSTLKNKYENWYCPTEFSLKIMDDWMLRCKTYLEKHCINILEYLRLENSSQVFCFGGISVVFNNSNERAATVVYQSDETEESSLCQIWYCYNGAGFYATPNIVINEQRHDIPCSDDSFNWLFMDGDIRMTEDMFMLWLQSFIEYINYTHIARPILVFLEKSFAKINMKSYKLAQENNILFFCFPLHSITEQPVFHGIGERIKDAVAHLFRENNVKTAADITKIIFSKFLTAWKENLSSDLAIESFAKCGLIPLCKRFIDVVSTIDGNTQRSHEVQVENINADVIRGMKIALKVIERKCLNPPTVEMYRTSLARGSQRCDASLKMWNVLAMEIEKQKRMLSKEQLRVCSISPVDDSDHVDINEHRVADAHGNEWPAHSVEMGVCEEPEIDFVSSSTQSFISHDPTNSGLSNCAVAHLTSCNFDLGSTVTDVSWSSASAELPPQSSSCGKKEEFVPISDRYRRPFNFDNMPAFNIDQHCAEIERRYRELNEIKPLEELSFDVCEDLGD